MRKRKILQFTLAASKGGQTQYVLNNWQNIDRERFHFDFVTFSKSLDFSAELEKQGCKIYYMPCYPQENPTLFYETFAKVLKNGYDTVHLNTKFWKGLEVEELSVKYRVPQIIIHAHSSGFQSISENKEEERLGRARHYEIRKRLSESAATDFVACSEAAAEWIFGEQIPKDRIKILRNAIDTHKFAFSEKKRKDMRREMGIEGKFVLGHVGRMVLVKNHMFLIDVFHEIAKIIPEAILLLTGDGGERQKIDEQIRSLNLQQKVMLLGKRDDVNLVMQAIDVLLLPSLFEGFPMVLVEAQTAGLPCVVSDQVTREAAITQLTHYEPLMATEWVKKILEIYKNNCSVRRSMQTEVATAGYEIQNQVKELEKLYERIQI